MILPLLGVLALILTSLYLGFRAVSWLFGRLSGWNRLALVYGCTPAPNVRTSQRETVNVAGIRFRRVVDVGIQPEGLYLRARAIFWFTPLLLPWNACHTPQSDTIYGRPSIRLSVGRPPCGSVALPLALYRRAAPYLALTAGTSAVSGSA